MKTFAILRPSLIISTSNNPRALNLVLEAISLQTRLPAEVLIADDGSGDDTAAIVEAWTRRLPIRVEHLWQPHQGFRKTVILDRAVRSATGDYLIFLDGDCLPHRRFVADHLHHAAPATFVQGRRAAVREAHVIHLSPRRIHPFRWYFRGWLYGLRFGWRRPLPTIRVDDRSLFQGCNFSVWRKDFFRVNGYDESFSGWGHEDTDLAERLSNAGVVGRIVEGQAVVYHLDHPRLPRPRADENERLLDRTKREKRTRCEHGITPRTEDMSVPLYS